MIRRLTWMVAVGVLAGSAAWAQDPRVEISGTAGWTFSDGVNVGAIDESPIQVGPKDAFSWGARLGFNLSPNVELGFLFNSQKTDLEATGVINRSIPQTVYNYHGYFAYNFGDTRRRGAPYFLGGLGATQYGSLSTAVGDIGGETQFSSPGRPASSCSRARSSASVSRPAGRPRTSSRTPRATGATPTGAATRSGRRSSRTSSSSPAVSSSGSRTPGGSGDRPGSLLGRPRPLVTPTDGLSPFGVTPGGGNPT